LFGLSKVSADRRHWRASAFELTHLIRTNTGARDKLERTVSEGTPASKSQEEKVDASHVVMRSNY
jgi:hypothetical protein